MSDCINDECVCKAKKKYSQGDPDFYCFKPNKRYGEIRNDPTIRTFDEHHYDMAVPCRFLLLHTQSMLKKKKDVVGSCECIVHGWNKKFKGKIYPAGYDIACDIQHNNGERKSATVRVEGVAQDGTFNFQEWGADGYYPDGPWTGNPAQILWSGVAKMKTEYKEKNNFAEVDVKECGVQVALRPYDYVQGSSSCQQNGVSFAVNCASDPVFLDEERMVVSAFGHGYVPFPDHIIPGLSAMESFFYRALTSEVVQNQPDGAEECQTIQPVIKQCNTLQKRVRGLKRCFWMLKEPRFIKCVDPTSNNANAIMRLVRRCFEALCAETITCDDLIQDIRDTGCTHTRVKGITELDDIMITEKCD